VLRLRYHLTTAAPIRLRLERLRPDGRTIVLRGPWLDRGDAGTNQLVVRFGHPEGHVPAGRYRMVIVPVVGAGRDAPATRVIVFRLTPPPR
jgi:hypothetical protein